MQPEAKQPLISLSGIYTAYEGDHAPVIRGLSLEIHRGEFIMVGGPNGAGKTTLLESMNGLLKITHGHATVCGLDVSNKGHEVRKRVGYVIQNFSFDPLTPFSVKEVVLMGRYGKMGFFRRPSAEDHQAVERALCMMGIKELADRPIGILSGGQQQKVLIAQNIARDPEIMLLDEPFSNLDFISREFVMDILEKLAESGIAIVLVSHAFDDLPDRDIRLVVMRDGTVCLDRTCPSEHVEATVREASSPGAVHA